jgi:hypothetical protein
MTWFYISFARAKADGGFLGATVVEGNDAGNALYNATMRDLNPGGEAQIVPVPRDKWEHPDFVALRYRLVGLDELAKMSGGYRIGHHEHGEFVCQDCNEQ